MKNPIVRSSSETSSSSHRPNPVISSSPLASLEGMLLVPILLAVANVFARPSSLHRYLRSTARPSPPRERLCYSPVFKIDTTWIRNGAISFSAGDNDDTSNEEVTDDGANKVHGPDEDTLEPVFGLMSVKILNRLT
ncbi:hypothetical protein S245_020837 [Arachis hypogaea]